MNLTTTEERVQFIKGRIAERKAFARRQRLQALDSTISEAESEEYVRLAELAEEYATAQERTLLVLFP